MKLDLTKGLVNVNGDILKTPTGEVATVGLTITQSLLTELNGDEKLEGVKKAELFNLWFDKIKDKKEADFKPEEVVLIKERIGKAYGMLVVGQMYKLLDK